MIKCNEFVSISELSNVITLFWPKLCIYTPCVFIPMHIRNTVPQKKFAIYLTARRGGSIGEEKSDKIDRGGVAE